MASTGPTPKEPQRKFTIAPTLEPWSISAREYIMFHQKVQEWNAIGTASVVFDPFGKVLLIQRAKHDSFPNKWELPGGAADWEDPSLLHAAARELWEESGLFAKGFTHVVTEGPGREPGFVFSSRSKTETYCRFTFQVEVEDCDAVKLDPNEHQDFVWASEDEVRDQKVGERELPITTESMAAVVLEAFKLRKEKIGASASVESVEKI